MLFRMLIVERTYQMTDGAMLKPRQLFVTQSPVLARKVKEYFATLLDALKASSWSVAEMSLHNTAKEIPYTEQDLVHEDDIDWHNDLPTRYSELQDVHFPVITTVDRVTICHNYTIIHK